MSEGTRILLGLIWDALLTGTIAGVAGWYLGRARGRDEGAREEEGWDELPPERNWPEPTRLASEEERQPTLAHTLWNIPWKSEWGL